jgi:hypothetical protein
MGEPASAGVVVLGFAKSGTAGARASGAGRGGWIAGVAELALARGALTGLPHCLQNFASGFNCAPHFRQNMAFLARRGRDKRAPECFRTAESA